MVMSGADYAFSGRGTLKVVTRVVTLRGYAYLVLYTNFENT